MERHQPPTLPETEMSASGVCTEEGGLRIGPTINVNEVVIFFISEKRINLSHKYAF